MQSQDFEELNINKASLVNDELNIVNNISEEIAEEVAEALVKKLVK